MTIATANLDITTDTFGTWLVKTNTLANYMSNNVVTVDQTTTGNNSTGNGFVIGVFGANTLVATTLRGGSVLTPSTLTISSNVGISNTLTVTNNTTLQANLAVTLGASFANTITVTGVASFSNNLNVTGNAAITGAFSANGAANVNNILGVSGAVTLANTISVTGTATLSNTLTVTGLTTLNGAINTTTANASVAVNVGANATVNTTTIRVGNTISNVVIGNSSIFIGNSTVNAIANSTTFTGTANNATNFNGQAASYYANATNLTSGTLDTARLPATANVATAINVGANVNLVTDRITVQRGTNSIYMVANSTNTEIKTGNTIITPINVKADTATFGNVVVMGDFSVAATLTANGNLVPAANDTFTIGNSSLTFSNGYILDLFGNTIVATDSITVGSNPSVNTIALTPTGITVGNTTVSATINATSFSGSANNSSNFNGQPASFYANATNLTSGTLDTARLPATANVATAVNVGANVTMDVTTIRVGNSTVNTVITQSTIDTDGTLAVLGATTLSNTLTVTGLTTLNGGINSTTANTTTAVNVGANVNLTTTQIKVGNTTANVTIGNNSINVNGATVNATNFTGNANTATALATSRNFQITGDVVAANVGFTGAGDVSLSAALSTTGVAAGEYTKVTVDTKGRVTNAAYITSGDVTSALTFTPANKAGDTFSGNTTFSANLVIGATGELIVTAGAGISANGALGTAGQVLHSNGTSVYWDTDDQGVTSVASGDGLSGGPITTTGTLSVLANNGITANSTGVFVIANTGLIANATGVFVNANTGLVGNATGIHVNATYISTLTANSANVLTTDRNFSITGDVTASVVSFNGSGDVALSSTLSNSGVVAGQYTKLTVDAKGRVTSGAYIASGDVTSALGYTPVNPASPGTFTGNYTIQNTSPTITLADTDNVTRSIHCNSNLVGFLNSSGAWAAYSDDAGNWTAAGNVAAYSDIKLKTNIIGIVDALKTVDKLRGVRYTRISNGNQEIGVIAQEVREVLPEVVNEGEDGTLSVSYGNIVAVLIEAIKELNKKVTSLEEQLASK